MAIDEKVFRVKGQRSRSRPNAAMVEACISMMWHEADLFYSVAEEPVNH